MTLQIYNTLTRKKETFKPMHGNHVGIYVCGPTVYGDAHLGHAKSYVSFDVIVRFLRHLKYDVLYVQNITDVGHLLESGEDRVLKKSKSENVHPMQVVERYTKSYFDDMDAMGVVRPDISPRATGHITEQIELVKTLLEKGSAYETNGSVYFSVKSFPDYGRLSNRSLEDMMEGTRVEVREEKKDPVDFALWKKAEPEHVMRWPSPWGEGFPGWHLECSAMSMKYLGVTFDIHGGGLDNQFPHHECEIAQSVSATGHPFARYWIHNNLVTVSGQKMSKSLNNFVTLKNAFAQYGPLVVRFFVLQSHYRSPLDYSDEAIRGAQGGLTKLLNTVRNVRESLAQGESGGRDEGKAFLPLEEYTDRFLNAMNDDFNTPQAIGVLFDCARDVNALLHGANPPSPETLQKVDEWFRTNGGTILGVIPDDLGSRDDGQPVLEKSLIELLIELRAVARQKKLWDLSDQIRDRLNAIGIVLEDKKEGTTWKRSSQTSGE